MTNSTRTFPSAVPPSPRQHRGHLRVKRVLLWGVVSAVAVAGVLALLTFTYFWRSPNYYDAPAIAGEVEDRIVGQPEYAEDHESPFFFRAGNAVVFGAEHTKDPNDPQIELITSSGTSLTRPSRWSGPAVFSRPGSMDPVQKYGDLGTCWAWKEARRGRRHLQHAGGGAVAALAERHPKERVAVDLVLGPTSAKTQPQTRSPRGVRRGVSCPRRISFGRRSDRRPGRRRPDLGPRLPRRPGLARCLRRVRAARLPPRRVRQLE